MPLRVLVTLSAREDGELKAFQAGLDIRRYKSDGSDECEI